MTSREFRHAHFLRALEDHNDSLEELAKAVGLSPQYLSQLKLGTRNIGDKTARKLEEKLGFNKGAWDLPLEGEDYLAEVSNLLRFIPEDKFLDIISEVLPDLTPETVDRISVEILKYRAASVAK